MEVTDRLPIDPVTNRPGPTRRPVTADRNTWLSGSALAAIAVNGGPL
jgi:hypothetical protein